MKNLLILGKIPVDPTVSYFLEKGYAVTLLQDQLLDFTGQESDFEKVMTVDFSNDDSIRKITEQIPKPDAIMCFYENYVYPKAILAQAYGMTTISPEDAVVATDKALMRQRFLETYPEISAQYREVKSLEEALDFAQTYGYPLMIKPANLVKSLLIQKCENETELVQNFTQTMAEIDGIYKKLHVPREPKVLVEEFLAGKLYSVDIFANKNGQVFVTEVVDLVFAKDLGVADTYNFARILPSRVDQDLANNITAAAVKAGQAIGLKNAAGHVEIAVDESGTAKVIEIGARFGGYRWKIYSRAFGFDLYDAELRSWDDQPFSFNKTKNVHTAVLELFPPQKGTFVKVTHEDELQKLASVHRYALKKEVGNTIGLAKDGYKMTAIVELINEDSQQFYQDYEFIRDNVEVIVE